MAKKDQPPSNVTPLHALLKRMPIVQMPMTRPHGDLPLMLFPPSYSLECRN